MSDRDDSLPPVHPPSLIALGKRRALTPDDDAQPPNSSPPSPKRPRQATTSPPPLQHSQSTHSTASQAIDLTESDPGGPLFTDDDGGGTATAGTQTPDIVELIDGENGVIDLSDEATEDEVEVIMDAAKARHAAAVDPNDIVDLTAESQSPERELQNAEPLAGPSNQPVNGVAGTDGRQYFSEMTCPICLTCVRRLHLRPARRFADPRIVLLLLSSSQSAVTPCAFTSHTSLHGSRRSHSCGACLHAAMLGQGTPAVPGSIDHGSCPVCRTELIGGWGKAIRGASFKVGPPRPPIPQSLITL